MPITKLENDALANTVAANVVSMSFGNSSVNTVVTSSGITLSNTATSQAFAVPLVAGEALTALDAVYVEPALTGGTAGRVYKMDADVLVKSTQAFFAGFALAGASAGANVNIQTSGIVSGFVGLTAGAIYYAGSTAGAITATKPLHPLPVGIAVSATQLYINIGNKREDEQSENVSAVYGYAMGGYTGGGTPVTTVDRIAFSTSITTASTASNLATARYNVGGTSDCSVYGYTFGGANGIAYLATGDRTTFSTSVTAASTISNLSSARSNPTGVSDGAIYGYAMGGYDPSSTTGDRITFSTSITAASTVSNLSTARGHAAGISDGSVYGYVTGGYTTGLASSTDRITFSTSATAAATGTTLSDARYTLTGLSDGAVYGYALGGYNATTIVATADRLTFTTGVSAASTISNLSVSRYSMPNQSVSDGNLYGYVFGGVNTSSLLVATTDRLIFSTSVTSAYTAANISQARAAMAGLSDGAV